MLEMKYIGSDESYQVEFKNLTKNIVQLKGNFPTKTDGFTLGRIGEPEAFTGDYSKYTTVYQELDDGVQFSNDGSKYVPPTPTVYFKSTSGGELNGKTVQEVSDYQNLIIPIPIQYPDYEFAGWSPAIPESGEVVGTASFTAIFASTIPQGDIESRVATLETDMQKINSALEGK